MPRCKKEYYEMGRYPKLRYALPAEPLSFTIKEKEAGAGCNPTNDVTGIWGGAPFYKFRIVDTTNEVTIIDYCRL